MNIIICGAGKVGFSIASYLEKTEHDTTIIDQSADLVRTLSERYDVRAIQGFASDPKVLKKAGAENADILIAVTQQDEVNMIACEVAHGVFNVPLKIARIRNQDYLSPEWIHLFEEKNISVDVTISPEVEVANAIQRGLSIPGAFSTMPMVRERVQVIGVKCTSSTPIVNTPIRHIAGIFPDVSFQIAAIFRGTDIIIPDENEKLLLDDDIYFVVEKEHLIEAMKAFGHFEEASRRVLILGAGNIGYHLAVQLDALNSSGMDVRLVEHKRERAEEISKMLQNIDVLSGDALSVELQSEAGVEKTETVVAVTNDDKVNTLSTLLAKQMGATRAMALINDPERIPLVKSLGVDSVINPREITVSSILRHIRPGFIQSVYSIRNNAAEIMEALISEDTGLAGVTLDEFNVPQNVKLLAIVRDDVVHFPSNDLAFEQGDHVVLIAKREHINDIEKMFSARIQYL